MSKKKISLIITIIVLSMSTIGCSNTQQDNVVIPEVKLNMQYDYSKLLTAIDYIINNNIATESELNKLDNVVSNSIKSDILNKVINNTDTSEIINLYRAEDTMFVQVKNMNKYNMYKLRIKDNMIVDYVVYQNLN